MELNKPREDDGFHHDGRIALPRWECDRIWQHVVDMSQPSAPQPKAVEIRDEAVRLGAAEFDAGWE